MSHKGRMISQDCARDPQLNALSLEAELLYLLTLPHLDRDGLIDGDPTLLAATVAPRRSELRDKAGRLLNEWIEQGLVLRYEGKDGPILFFKGFRRHNPNLVYDREPESRFPPPPGHFRGEYGLIPDNPDVANYLAESFDSRANYAKELALYASNTPYADTDERENYPRTRDQGARRNAQAKPGAATQQHRNSQSKPAASLLQACDIDATDLPIGGFSPVEPEVAFMLQTCGMNATANDDDDDSIYPSSSSVVVTSEGGSGGKHYTNAASSENTGYPLGAAPRNSPPTSTPEPTPATATMRQLAKEIASDLRAWTGSARFIDSLDSDQLIALISWLWLWERLYNQHDVYEQTWARQRYPDNPFESIRKSLPGKIITQARLGNPYPLHPLDSQDLQTVLTERAQGNPIRRPVQAQHEEICPAGSDSEAAEAESAGAAKGAHTSIPSTTAAAAQAIWSQVLTELSVSIPSATFTTWVRDTWGLAYTGDDFIVGLPNAYARDWMNNRLRYKIQRTLASLLNQQVTVRFEVVEQHAIARKE